MMCDMLVFREAASTSESRKNLSKSPKIEILIIFCWLEFGFIQDILLSIFAFLNRAATQATNNWQVLIQVVRECTRLFAFDQLNPLRFGKEGVGRIEQAVQDLKCLYDQFLVIVVCQIKQWGNKFPWLCITLRQKIKVLMLSDHPVAFADDLVQVADDFTAVMHDGCCVIRLDMMDAELVQYRVEFVVWMPFAQVFKLQNKMLFITLLVLDQSK